MTRTFVMTAIIALLSMGPVQAAPNAQLVNSVQKQLNLHGFSHVDAATLTNQQIGALHLKFSQSIALFGMESIRRKQEIKVILGWTE